MATEEILMRCVKRGASRQDAHERLKIHARSAWDAMLETGSSEGFVASLNADDRLPITADEVHELLAEPARFCGLAPEQTRRFVAHVRERLSCYNDRIGTCEDRVTV